MKKLILFLGTIAVSAFVYSTLQANETISRCASGSLGVCVQAPNGQKCSHPVNAQNNDCDITINWPVVPTPAPGD